MATSSSGEGLMVESGKEADVSRRKEEENGVGPPTLKVSDLGTRSNHLHEKGINLLLRADPLRLLKGSVIIHWRLPHHLLW